MQETNSIRKGQHWDDANGGWLGPVLIRNARRGYAVRKEARGVRIGPHEPVLEGNGEQHHQNKLGRTRTRQRRSVLT